MCTLIAFHRCFADAPLVVAANRDEFLERPTEGPALREASISSSRRTGRSGRGGASARATRVVAPRDLRAGGSWLGVNASGLFAAITNRRCDSPDPSRRSRGWLVMEALAEPSAERAAERFARLPGDAYNPFNLFVADRESAHVVTYSDRPQRRERDHRQRGEQEQRRRIDGVERGEPVCGVAARRRDDAIEHHLQRPRLEQIREAFSNNCNEGETEGKNVRI